jgi:hypothetical protein
MEHRLLKHHYATYRMDILWYIHSSISNIRSYI